jgi:hypothetical protein
MGAPATGPTSNVQETAGGAPAAPKGSLGDPTGKNTQVTIDNPAFKPLGDTTVQGIVGRIIKFILGLTGVIALIMVTYGGLLWMTAAGDAQKVELAKKTIFWSMAGIVVIFSAFALVNFVLSSIS